MITIYGASDDLVEVDGCEGADEFSPDSLGNWHGDLIGPDGSQLRVLASYERNGCWSVGACQVDEEVPLPGWPVTITQAAALNGPGYSALLTIDAPDGTRLTNIHPAPGD